MLDISQAQREYEALGRLQRATLAARVNPPTAAAETLGLTHATGARVLDLVSGVEGSILDGSGEQLIIDHA